MFRFRRRNVFPARGVEQDHGKRKFGTRARRHGPVRVVVVLAEVVYDRAVARRRRVTRRRSRRRFPSRKRRRRRRRGPRHCFRRSAGGGSARRPRSRTSRPVASRRHTPPSETSRVRARRPSGSTADVSGTANRRLGRRARTRFRTEARRREARRRRRRLEWRRRRRARRRRRSTTRLYLWVWPRARPRRDPGTAQSLARDRFESLSRVAEFAPSRRAPSRRLRRRRRTRRLPALRCFDRGRGTRPVPRTGCGARSTSRRVLSRPGRFSRRAASLARLRRRPREARPEEDSCTRARRLNARGSRCPSRARRPRRGATWPCPRRCSGRASWRVARCASWPARWRGLDRGAGAARGAPGAESVLASSSFGSSRDASAYRTRRFPRDPGVSVRRPGAHGLVQAEQRAYAGSRVQRGHEPHLGGPGVREADVYPSLVKRLEKRLRPGLGRSARRGGGCGRHEDVGCAPGTASCDGGRKRAVERPLATRGARGRLCLASVRTREEGSRRVVSTFDRDDERFFFLLLSKQRVFFVPGPARY